jgi:hypothetical protein
MEIEFPNMAMANPANLAKAGGKQNEFCSLAMANLAKLANFDLGDDGFSRFSQKSHSHPAEMKLSAESGMVDLSTEQSGEFSRVSQLSHSHPAEFNSSGSHRPLTDARLTDLMSRTAKTNGLDPLDVWRWMDLSTVEDVRGGDPAVIRGFRGGVESAVKSGTLLPDGGHDLPFPGKAPSPDRYSVTPITCRDCANQEPTDHPALIRCGAGQPAPGACGMWWKTDRHVCPLFAPISTREAKA